MGILESKVAFVTGGGQGIGEGIAIELAKAGANVVVAQRNLDNAETVASKIRKLGRESIALQLDVTDIASIKNCAETVRENFSRIDILVNNAGIGQKAFELETSSEEFDLCYNVNLKSIWTQINEFLPYLKAHNEGKIINISSIEGRRGTKYQPAYSASKAAVISLTQSLSALLGSDNINVNAVCPGPVWTPQQENFQHLFNKDKAENPINEENFFKDYVEHIPLRRVATPQDIGCAVVFLASPQAKNITGQALNVDGGLFMN